MARSFSCRPVRSVRISSPKLPATPATAPRIGTPELVVCYVCAGIAVHPSGAYAYVLDAISRGPLWQRETGLSIGFMPAYDPDAGDGGILFIAGEKGQIFAVDPATGTDRWAPVTLETAYGNMALANGLLFVAVATGKVFVLEAATGRILRQLTPANPGPSFSGIAVAGNAIYWLSGRMLNAWGVP